MCAQAAHAAVTTAEWIRSYGTLGQTNSYIIWLKKGQKKIVVGVDSFEELDALSVKALAANVHFEMITDAGHTEFHGVPTVTCMVLGPDTDENLDPITGELKLL